MPRVFLNFFNYFESINYITTCNLFRELKKYNVAINNVGRERFKKQKSKSMIKNIVNKFLDLLHLYPIIDILVYKK